MIRDPGLIKQICVKDFEHFIDHRSLMPVETEPLWGNNLLELKGTFKPIINKKLFMILATEILLLFTVIQVKNGDVCVQH